MKKITLLIFMFWGLIIGSSAQKQITISRFEGKQITGIEANGAFKVTAKQGESTGASVNIPARFEEQLTFELKPDGTLLIGLEGYVKTRRNETFTAEVTLSSLQTAELSGASSLDLQGKINAMNLSIRLTGASSLQSAVPIVVEQNAKIQLLGASKLTGELTASTVTFNISGASGLTLTGKSLVGVIKVSGASNARLENFSIDNADITVSGASHTNIRVLKELSLEARGASKITYTGTPKITKIESTGASKIKQK